MARLLMLLVLTIFSTRVYAQTDLTKLKLPVDSTFLTGELKNGMRYYIKKNEKPKGVADFYIARSVGAIQEDDNQTGMAHFLEHMAFNGTKNLPDKAMLNYLQSIGAEFGKNINAYTGMDRTVYILNDIPLRRQAIIDSALVILYEWSRNISLLPEEVNKERGVIIEELRTRNSADFRISHKTAPYIYNGTKYKDRDILGTKEQLQNFKQEDIESFYKEWYRPEYQAIIAIGDFDPVAMEKEVIEIFSKLESPENVRDKEKIVIPNYEENRYAVFTDPEVTTSSISYYVPFKEYNSEENLYYDAHIRKFLKQIITSSINERLSDITRKENPPFLGAYTYSIPLTNYTEYMAGIINVEEKGSAKGLESYIGELNRLRNHGITEDEYNRAILATRTSLEAKIKREKDTKSSEYVQKALANFLDNDPLMTPSQQLEIFDQITNMVNVDIANSYITAVLPNLPGAILATTPEKEGAIPTVSELEAAFQAGQSANLPPLEEIAIASSLITQPITPGKIVKESSDELGNIVWTLSNGATMVLRPTKLKQDEVILSGLGYGGESYLDVEQLVSAEVLSTVAQQSGLGDFSASEFKKIMTGKHGWASLKNDEIYSMITGGSTSKMSDLEVMFQQLYLKFELPRFEQAAFDNTINLYSNSLLNYESNPEYIFQDSISYDIYGANPRKLAIRELKNKLGSVTLDDVKETYSTLHQGIDGYKLYLVGNFEPDSIKGFVEKYVASIKKGTKRDILDREVYLTDEDLSKDYYLKMKDPKSSVIVIYEGDKMKYNLKNAVAVSILSELLKLRYTEIIREQKGATYGVGVYAELGFQPRTIPSISVQFDTNEKQASEMADIVSEQLELIADGTIKSEDFAKTIMAQQKSFELREKENGAWMGWIDTYYKTGIDYHKDYIETLNSIREKDIIDIAKEIVKNSNKKRLIMYPKE